MNEIGKTLVFVLAAVVLGVVAVIAHFTTLPSDVEGFEKVGKEFFPEFTEPGNARSLEVTAYDEDRGMPRSFLVEYRDGLWRIPSHYGYPAEAAERLASTATSLMGVVRESVPSRRQADQERFGVVDPADEDAVAGNAGTRITLRDAGGETLVDFIVGKPAGSDPRDNEDSMVRGATEESDFYYVRVPGEKETYKARIQIDLSTRFTDWIEPDLLKVDGGDFHRLRIDSYELHEQVRGRELLVTKIPHGQFILTRDEFGPWKMEGIDESTEALKTPKVNEIVSLLDELQIVGVRPKPTLDGKPLVDSQLKVDAELARENPGEFRDRLIELRQDLEDKGFVIGAAQNDPDTLMLLATRGELHATTKNGAAFTLYFGKGVSGDEIGIGAPQDDTSTNDSQTDTEAKPDAASPAGEDEAQPRTENGPESKEDEEATASNRYVAIRVGFEPAALGEAPARPEEPAEPPKPDGYDEWRAKQPETGDAEFPADPDGEASSESTSDDETEPAPSNTDEAPMPPADIAAATDEKFREYESALEKYKEDSFQYATDLEMYEADLSEFEEREKAGKELVKQLDERFALWYYVVPASSIKTFNLTREDLVGPRETPPSPMDGPALMNEPDLPVRPDISMPPPEPETGETPQESDDGPQESDDAPQDGNDAPRTNDDVPPPGDDGG